MLMWNFFTFLYKSGKNEFGGNEATEPPGSGNFGAGTAKWGG